MLYVYVIIRVNVLVINCYFYEFRYKYHDYPKVEVVYIFGYTPVYMFPIIVKNVH